MTKSSVSSSRDDVRAQQRRLEELIKRVKLSDAKAGSVRWFEF